MKRIVATLLAFLFATAAHAQSGLLPANWVWAGPPSGGQGFARARALVTADLPTLAPGGLSLASGQIMVGQVSGFAGAVAMSGDCTIVASGAITCPKANGVTFGALATVTAGTGVATAAAINVGSAGAVVVNGGALGTPSSGALTNATGLPISTGVSGLGTGVATALGVAVGSAGAPLVNGGVLGTPSSGVGTNLTALNASNLSSGTLPAARLPLTNTSFSVASVTAAGNNSASPLMAGAGVTNCKLTPTYSGRVLVHFDTSISNGGASSIGMTLALRFGTGTAPVSNAAATGTIVSGPFVYTSDAGGTRPSTMSAVITGLTPGTAYWFDFSLTSNGSIILTPAYGCNGFEF